MLDFKALKSKIEPNHVLIAAVVISIFLINYIYEPFKVTDPADPRFDVSEFKMRDYDLLDLKSRVTHKPKLRYALKRIFKPGDDKSFVDEVFVKAARAESEIYKTYPDEKMYDVRYVFGCGYLFKIYDQYCMGWVNSNAMVIMVRYASTTNTLIDMYPRGGYGIFNESRKRESA